MNNRREGDGGNTMTPGGAKTSRENHDLLAQEEGRSHERSIKRDKQEQGIKDEPTGGGYRGESRSWYR